MSRWWLNPALWSGIGILGQVMFGSRFLVQWIASEAKKRSVVPRAFWYLSLFGGVTLFAYACYRRDPVFVLGQGAGLFVYARNLMFPRASASPA